MSMFCDTVWNYYIYTNLNTFLIIQQKIIYSFNHINILNLSHLNTHLRLSRYLPSSYHMT